MPEPTAYTESNILLAVAQGDLHHACALIDGMSEVERAALATATATVQQLLRSRDAPAPPPASRPGRPEPADHIGLCRDDWCEVGLCRDYCNGCICPCHTR